MTTQLINGIEYRTTQKYPNILIADGGMAIGPSGRILKLQHIRGYPAYGVQQADGKYRMVRAHLLVAEAFLGSRPTGLFIDHINRVVTDNRAANLRYVTNAVNLANNARTAKGLPVGVYPSGNRFRAQVQLGHTKAKHIGHYATQEEAIAARAAYLLAMKDAAVHRSQEQPN